VGFALATLATERMGLSYAILFIGGAAAWAASERFLAPRLLGSDARTVALAVASGLAFPWVGFAAAWALHAIRP
jgi:hypothetical protein